MMKVKGIFAVSFIAMMVVGGAYADIASSGYVDEKIDGLATVAKTGAYGDLSGRPTIPTVNNATLTIQKNGATVDTFTANASANKTINITVPTTTSQLTNNSGFITAANLPEEYTLPVATANALGGVKSAGDITVGTDGAVTVNSATKADSATKATQDASGNVITSTYATKSELTSGLSGKQATLSVAQLNAVNSGITSTKVSTYDGYSAKITAAQSAASAAQTAANGKVTANAAITAGTATKITYDAKGLVTGGASLTASDIPTIPSTKVSGLSTVATTGSYDDLADKPTIPSAYVLKAATSSALGGVKSGGNITVGSDGAVTVNSATKASQDASGNVITSTYATKTELSAKQNASTAVEVATAGTAVGDSTHPVYVNASGVATKIDKVAAAAKADTATSATTATKATQDASGNVITSTYATKSQITALDSTSTGTGAVVTGVSQTDGKVTVTKGNVEIPFGGRNATDYVAIWVE